jgi:hypothetical protein
MITGPVFDAKRIYDGHEMWILQPLFRQMTDKENINVQSFRLCHCGDYII